MTQRNHVRSSERVWAGLTATAVAVTALASATTGSAAALPTAGPFADHGTAAAAFANRAGTEGGPASVTAARDSNDGSRFAEQFPESFVTVSDPLFDSKFGLAEADIVNVTGEMNASGFTWFAVTVDLWTDPLSEDWATGDTYPLWYLDTDGDPSAEYYAWFVNRSGSFQGGLINTKNEVVCTISYDYDPANSSYSLGLPSNCLGVNLPQIRMHAQFWYEDVSAATPDVDNAPDTTWSSAILNDAYDPAWVTLSTVLPYRLYDSRTMAGVRPAGSVTEVQVTGLGGVPVGAATALLNVTAVAPSAAGFMTVFPCGQAAPQASNLNFAAGQTIPNAAVVKLDASGRVCVFTSAVSGLLVDVNGYTPATSDISALNPYRLYDSRSSNGMGPAGSVTYIKVTGVGGVPATAAAALLNVTAVSAAADGYMTVFPCGTPLPDASNLNYRAGQTIANTVLARLGVGGLVCVYTSAAAGLLVDVNASVPVGSGLAAVDPFQLHDTRNGSGPLAAGSITQVVIAGRGGVAAGATTAVLNVTVISAQEPGFATVFPCGADLPQVSNLNFNTGETIPNAVVAKIGEGGAVCVYTSAAAGLLVDVNGYAT